MIDNLTPYGEMSPQEKRNLLEKLLKETAARTNTGLPAHAERAAIQTLDRKQKYFPLSSAQQRLWLLDQIDAGNPVYNINFVVRLKGDLNVTALEQSLLAIQNRQEILNINFTSLDGEPVQYLVPGRKLELLRIDLSEEPEARQLEQAEAFTRREAQRSFNLSKDILVRANLIRLGAVDHLFQFIIHHIIFDGWSLNLFFQEIASCYSAFVKNEEANLPPLSIQYLDFAGWENEQLQKGLGEEHLAYWRRQLGGHLPALEMPIDKPRPEIQTFKAGKAAMDISQSLTKAVLALSRQEGVTPFVTLLSAYYALLTRYTSQDDIIVGTPVAGRNLFEVEKLIGVFVNNLALRTDLSGTVTFRELLKRVRDTVLNALAHQEIPFERLLNELRIERDPSRTPVFQAFFNLLDVRKGLTGELPGVAVETPPPPEVGSLFDLTLYVQTWDDTLKLKLIYNIDLFRPDRMTELLQQYHQLLQAAVTAPDQSIKSYSLVTPYATQLLPNPVEPLDATWYGAVHKKFSENAAGSPEKTAIVDKNGAWTYGELDKRTNQLSRFLRRNGLDSGHVVAVYGHRSAALVWAIIGILKAGGAFMVIDPAYPVRRQLDYLEIADPRGLIHLQAAGDLPPEVEEWAANSVGNCRISLPGGLPSAHKGVLDEYPEEDPGISVGPEDTAYIAFTSGSTGKPKGVIGRHGPLSHFIPWQSETFTLSENDHFSMLSGLSHDPLQRDIFTALWVGASIHIPDPEQIGRPGWLNQWMKQEEITFSHLTPAMAQILATGNSHELNPDRQITTLRYVFFVGDKLTRHDVNQLGQLAPNVICINSYGSTETQRAVGYLLVDPKETASVGSIGFQGKAVIPVGRGMKDVQLLVLTGNRQLAGIGELGEIHVRSPHLAKGYLGDEALTQERFIVSPFTNDPHDRLYRSGDLGRFLPDGNVEFLGRKDTQVKIRGFRIELGEIETVLNEHPAVKQSVVNTWAPDNDDIRLVAYVVLKETESSIASKLLDYLRSRLPAHMIPAKFILLESLPITPNGKINRAALPAPDLAQSEPSDAYIAPRDDVERIVTSIFSNILNFENVGIHDSFFDLGGHSLMATRVLSRINEKFAVQLSLRNFFTAPTVAGVSEAIKTILWAVQSESGTPGSLTGDREEIEV